MCVALQSVPVHESGTCRSDHEDMQHQLDQIHCHASDDKDTAANGDGPAMPPRVHCYAGMAEYTSNGAKT